MTDDLDRALNDWRMPVANRDLVRRMCASIGIAEYNLTKSYIRAIWG